MILTNTKPYRVWTLLGLLAACSGDAQKGPVHREPGDRDGSASGTEGEDGGEDEQRDGGPDDLAWAVTLGADKVELCAGECTTLRAVLPETDLKLTYAWSSGLTGGSEVQVCPAETTSYELSITEVVQEGVELTVPRTASDRLTVSVKSCDPESPVLCEARYRYEFTNDGNVLQSAKPWISSQSRHSTLRRLPDGGVVFAATFGQRIDLGAGAVTAGSGANGLIHKYDENCKPVWTRVMAPSLKTDVLIPLTLAVDSAGNSYAASMGGPLISFDPLAKLSTTFATELVVYKFSNEGKELYRKSLVLGAGLAAGGTLLDSAVDDQGQLYLSGIAHAWTDFGGGPLDLSPTAFRTFLLKLDVQGNYGAHTTSAIYQLASGKDRVSFLDQGGQGFDLLEIFLGQNRQYTRNVTALATSTLSLLWAVQVPDEEYWYQALLGYPDGRLLGFVTRGGVESDDVQRTETFQWGVRPWAADGTPEPMLMFLEDTVTTPVDADAGVALWLASPYLSHSTLGANGEVALGGAYYRPWTIGPLATTLPYDELESDTARYGEVFVLKLDAQFELLWARAPEWGKRPALAGLDMAANGDVWLQGQGQVVGVGGELSDERDMVITKLRGTP